MMDELFVRGSHVSASGRHRLRADRSRRCRWTYLRRARQKHTSPGYSSRRLWHCRRSGGLRCTAKVETRFHCSQDSAFRPSGISASNPLGCHLVHHCARRGIGHVGTAQLGQIVQQLLVRHVGHGGHGGHLMQRDARYHIVGLTRFRWRAKSYGFSARMYSSAPGTASSAWLRCISPVRCRTVMPLHPLSTATATRRRDRPRLPSGRRTRHLQRSDTIRPTSHRCGRARRVTLALVEPPATGPILGSHPARKYHQGQLYFANSHGADSRSATASWFLSRAPVRALARTICVRRPGGNACGSRWYGQPQCVPGFPGIHCPPAFHDPADADTEDRHARPGEPFARRCDA